MLANPLVRQDFGSIELYFLFYFRMDCGCVTRRAESKKRKNKEDRAEYPGPMPSLLFDRLDNRSAPVIWVVRSIGATVRSIGQARVLRESLFTLCAIVSF